MAYQYGNMAGFRTRNTTGVLTVVRLRTSATDIEVQRRVKSDVESHHTWCLSCWIFGIRSISDLVYASIKNITCQMRFWGANRGSDRATGNVHRADGCSLALFERTVEGDNLHRTFKKLETIIYRTLEINSDENIKKKGETMLRELKKGDRVLKRSLWGLRWAGRAWNSELNDVLLSIGAKLSDSDLRFYEIKHEKLLPF